MKIFIKTLYPGEDFAVERKEILRNKLNEDGFYVLSGPDNTLEVSAIREETYWEQVLVDEYLLKFVQPLKNLSVKIGAYLYGKLA